MLVVWSGWGGVCWWCGVGEVVYVGGVEWVR